MVKQKHRRTEQQQNPIVPIAIGLLLIGTAMVWFALSNTKSNTGSGDGPDGFSRAPLSVDFPAPDLSLESIDGKTESLADYPSTVVLINNWAIWCPPCKAEMPVLEAYYEEHAGEGFVIIAVEAGDAKEDVSQFARDFNLKFQVWLDPANASLKAFGNANLPNSYVIDRQGTVRYAWTGEINRVTLETYVTPLLTE